ncbi:MAG: cation diffusion facilitator family transporter [Alphaproteobacteria bacterium]|nr:cation diffusion facilitator family transporter [Alphaproteobacteria bacterium]
MNEKKRNRLMILAGLGSLITTCFLLIIKAIAFVGTGSVAILSGLFDSVQDFMTSMINMVAVHQAVQPADKAHRFGHGKAQGIGGLLQAFIISVSAVLLFVESILHLLRSESVQRIGLGIWVTLIAIALTGILVVFQNYVIRETKALSIKADRAHYAGDTLMNIGILISLLMSHYLSWTWVDGVFGIVVAFYLLYTVWGIMQEACAMLMDKELSVEIRDEIRELALSVPLVKNVSSLRTREGGNKRFVQFNVQFDGRVSLQKTHDQLDEIERVIRAKYPEMEVIIHAEPFDPAKQKKGKKCRV